MAQIKERCGSCGRILHGGLWNPILSAWWKSDEGPKSKMEIDWHWNWM